MNQNKSLSSLLILLASFVNMQAQDYSANVFIKASRYNLSASNQNDHHVSMKLIFKDKVLDEKIGSTGSTVQAEGYFTKKKLKKTQVICTYNQTCHKRDLEVLRRDYNTGKNTIHSEYKKMNKSNNSFLVSRLAADLASNIKVDNSNWVTSIITGGIKLGGSLVKWADQTVQGFSKILSAKTDVELLVAIADASYGIPDWRQELVKQAMVKAGVSGYLTKYSAKAVVLWIDEGFRLDQQLKERLERLENERDARNNYLDHLYANRHLFESTGRFNIYDKAQKPINFRTKTPIATITIDPACYGNDISSHWQSANDPLFKTDENDETEFGNGWVNKNFRAELGFAISREFKLSRKNYSRLYANALYSNATYQLKAENYLLSRNFFRTVPVSEDVFNLTQPIEFDHTSYGINLILRNYLGRSAMIDLIGGYVHQEGKLNLGNAKLSEGFQWAFDSKTFIQGSNNWNGGIRFGLGGNNWSKRKSTMFTASVIASMPAFKQSGEEQITNLDTDQEILLENDGFLLRYNFGLTVSF